MRSARPNRTGIPIPRPRTGWVLLAMALFIAAGCSPVRETTETRTFLGMGTAGSLVTPAGEREKAAEWTAMSAGIVAGLEARFSIFRPDSDFSRLNAAAGREPVEVTPETAELIDLAQRTSRDSGGAFDLTVGPLMALWGFRGSNAALRIPTPREIAVTRESVGYEHVAVSGRTVRLDSAGVRLDAGGIGKGYAVDRAWETLRGPGGATNFLINLGGNMRASGKPGAARDWSVGVRNPFQKNALLGQLRLEDGMAVATSGHYERFVEIGGVRHAHIMDPRAGRPVQGMAGVTVLAHSATEADALSTTLFVMGPETGVPMLARTGRRAEALFVPDRQPLEVWCTPGLQARFEPIAGLTVHTLK